MIRLTDEERKVRKREYDRLRSVRRREIEPESIKAHNKKWYEANREHRREYQYLRKYGLTIAEYDAKVVEQNGCCAVCGTNKPGRWNRWHIDHCSTTGVVRGLLCSSCNMGQGLFKHDIALLQRAIDYLKSFN